MAQQTIRTNSNGTELAQPGHAGFGPFYRSSTNKTYHVDACLGNQTLEMWAAVDAIGGGSWSELDGANNPTVASGMLSCEAIMSNDGTKIYMVLVTNTAINFYEFNCTTDTWTTANTETLMGNVVTVGNEAAVTITETANGNIFVGTYHDDDRVMGKDYARVVYHRRVSGTWTKEVALDDVTAAAHHFNAKAFTSGTANETHYVWFVDVNNTWNTEIDRLQCTTLDTSWNLATVDESAAISTGPAGSYAAASNAAYASGYDNHTEYQLWWDEITGGTNSGKRHSFIEGLGDELDFSGGWGSSSSAIQDTDSDGFGKLYQSWKVYESAAVTNNRHLVRVFIDGGTDLKYDSTTADPIVWPDPNAPSSFSPTTIQTGTGDFHGITCDIFEKDDGSTVLGVVYSEADLADKLYYDEVVLYASGTDISTNAPDALVITEQQATVQANVDTDISTNAPDALAITELQATVSVGVNINTNAPDALTITEQPATVQANVDTDILANAPCLPEFGNSFSSAFSSTRDCASALILSPNSALVFVGEDKFIFPNTDALVITELPATVQANVDTDISTNAPDALVISELPADVNLNVSIDANADALVITELPATVQADVDTNIDANTDALVITELPATVQANVDTDISANLDALVITEQPATVQANVDTDISANLDALVITELPADVDLDVNIDAGTDALVISELPATVQANVDTDISANLDTLVITELPADVTTGTTVNANTDALVITELPATVQADVDTNIDAGTDALVISELPATVQANVDTDISANLDTLVISELPATVQANVDTDISANLDALVISELPATVQANVDTDISANLDTLVISEQPATVQADVDTNIDANLDTLVITELVAQVQAGQDTNIAADFDTLVISELPATVQANVDTDISANLDTLVITEQPATVQGNVDTDISANLDTLVITELVAQVQVGADTDISAGTDSLIITELPAQVSRDTDIAAACADVDPDWSSVTLLANAERGLINDDSTAGLALSVFGSPVIDTSTPKNLGADHVSIDYAGANTDRVNYVKSADSAGLNLPGEFTIEGWFRIAEHPDTSSAWGLFATDDTAQFLDGSLGWQVIYSTAAIRTWRFFFSNGAGWVVRSCGSLALDQWYHLEMTRDASGNIRNFRDGILQDTYNDTRTFNQNSKGFHIATANGVSFDLKGDWQEFRVTKGVCRHTSNFTPPSAVFPRTDGPCPIFLGPRPATVLAATGIDANTDALVITELPATVQAGQDTNISANTDALVIAEQPATVQANVDTDISANLDTLVITEQPATVEAGADTNISANFDTLTITELPAIVQSGSDTVIPANTDALTITEQPAIAGTLKVWVNDTPSKTGAVLQTAISCTATTITLGPLEQGGLGTGQMYIAVERPDGAISNWYPFNVNFEPGKIFAGFDTLVISELPATVQANVDTDIAANADALVIAEQPATVQANVDTDILAETDAVWIAPRPAAVQANVDTSVSANTRQLNLQPWAASLVIGTAVSIGANTAALAITEQPASLSQPASATADHVGVGALQDAQSNVYARIYSDAIHLNPGALQSADGNIYAVVSASALHQGGGAQQTATGLTNADVYGTANHVGGGAVQTVSAQAYIYYIVDEKDRTYRPAECPSIRDFEVKVTWIYCGEVLPDVTEPVQGLQYFFGFGTRDNSYGPINNSLGQPQAIYYNFEEELNEATVVRIYDTNVTDACRMYTEAIPRNTLIGAGSGDGLFLAWGQYGNLWFVNTNEDPPVLHYQDRCYYQQFTGSSSTNGFPSGSTASPQYHTYVASTKTPVATIVRPTSTGAENPRSPGISHSLVGGVASVEDAVNSHLLDDDYVLQFSNQKRYTNISQVETITDYLGVNFGQDVPTSSIFTGVGSDLVARGKYCWQMLFTPTYIPADGRVVFYSDEVFTFYIDAATGKIGVAFWENQFDTPGQVPEFLDTINSDPTLGVGNWSTIEAGKTYYVCFGRGWEKAQTPIPGQVLYGQPFASIADVSQQCAASGHQKTTWVDIFPPFGFWSEELTYDVPKAQLAESTDPNRNPAINDYYGGNNGPIDLSTARFGAAQDNYELDIVPWENFVGYIHEARLSYIQLDAGQSDRNLFMCHHAPRRRFRERGDGTTQAHIITQSISSLGRFSPKVNLDPLNEGWRNLWYDWELIPNTGSVFDAMWEQAQHFSDTDELVTVLQATTFDKYQSMVVKNFLYLGGDSVVGTGAGDIRLMPAVGKGSGVPIKLGNGNIALFGIDGFVEEAYLSTDKFVTANAAAYGSAADNLASAEGVALLTHSGRIAMYRGVSVLPPELIATPPDFGVMYSDDNGATWQQEINASMRFLDDQGQAIGTIAEEHYFYDKRTNEVFAAGFTSGGTDNVSILKSSDGINFTFVYYGSMSSSGNFYGLIPASTVSDNINRE